MIFWVLEILKILFQNIVLIFCDHKPNVACDITLFITFNKSALLQSTTRSKKYSSRMLLAQDLTEIVELIEDVA